MNKKIFFSILLLLSAGCQRVATPSPTPAAKPNSANSYVTPFYVADKKIFVEIADTESKREKGLSGREPITDEQGMLFKFDSKVMPGFWMKDMKFDLDFIWITDGKIVAITPDAPAPKSSTEKLQTYFPPSSVDSVLEVNAGWSEKNNIKTGNEVRLENYSN